MRILYQLATARSAALIAILSSLPAVARGQDCLAQTGQCDAWTTCADIGFPGYCCSQYGVSRSYRLKYQEILTSSPPTTPLLYSILVLVTVVWNHVRVLRYVLSEWTLHESAIVSTTTPAIASHQLQLWSYSWRRFASRCILGKLANLPNHQSIRRILPHSHRLCGIVHLVANEE
jgi:hypothetical protein